MIQCDIPFLSNLFKKKTVTLFWAKRNTKKDIVEIFLFSTVISVSSFTSIGFKQIFYADYKYIDRILSPDFVKWKTRELVEQNTFPKYREVILFMI